MLEITGNIFYPSTYSLSPNKKRLIYLLKSQKAKTITQASEFLGRHRVTLQVQFVDRQILVLH